MIRKKSQLRNLLSPLQLKAPRDNPRKLFGVGVDEIKRYLEKMAEGEGNAVRSSVRFGRIQLREFDPDDPISKSDRPYIQREPDEQFQHADAEYPGVVCEIAYSQNCEDLDKAVWVYIPIQMGT